MLQKHGNIYILCMYDPNLWKLEWDHIRTRTSLFLWNERIKKNQIDSIKIEEISTSSGERINTRDVWYWMVIYWLLIDTIIQNSEFNTRIVHFNFILNELK